MQKKFLIGIILVCLVGIISFFYVFLKKKSQVFQNNVYELISDNTVLFAEIKDIENFLTLSDSSQNSSEGLHVFPIISEALTVLQPLDSTIKLHSDFDVFLKNQFVISVLQIAKNKLDYVFLLPLTSDFQVANAHKFMQKSFSTFSVDSYNYDGKHTIYNFVQAESKKANLSYTICNNTLIIGFSRMFIEGAIRSYIDKANITHIADFTKVKKTAGNRVYANVYINFNRFPQLISIITAEEHKSSFMQSFKLASWSEFDIIQHKNALMLTGYSTTSAAGEYLQIFKNQQAVKFSIPQVIPSGITNFLSIGISDKKKFKQDYESYLTEKHEFDSYQSRLKAINEQFSTESQPVKVDELMYSILDNELAVVHGASSGTDKYENSFVVCKTIGKQSAQDAFLPIIDSYCEKQSVKLSDITFNYTIDNESIYKIYKLPTSKIPYALWGDFFAQIEANYITFIQNHIVFGKTLPALQRYIAAFELKKILAHDYAFNKTQNNVLDSYNLYVYSNVARSIDMYSEFLDAKSKTFLQNNSQVLKQCNSLVVQIKAGAGMYYNNIFLNYNSSVEDRPHTLWESYTDTTIICKPKIYNHQGVGTSILVQDGYYNLLSLNSNGKVQWKMNIKEPIISDFYMVDFYKNGKYQYMFNTPSYIYLIDRLGNFVETYPVKLPSKATSSIAVIDYNNTKDYRIFVACEDKNIYLYSKKGTQISDWKSEPTETIVRTPLQHFEYEGKDYLVYADTYNMYIVDRQGKTRVRVKEQILKSPNNAFVFEPKTANTAARFVTTDIGGNVKYIDLQGNVQTLELEPRSENHFFEYKDFNNDGKNDFMFVDNKNLHIISQKKKLISSFTFENSIELRPIVYSFSKTNLKIGVVDNTSARVYLINSNGSLHKGFPLKGNSLFSIGYVYPQSQSFNLIIGSDKKFLYNYEVR